MDKNRIEELILRYFDGDSSLEEIRELEEEIITSPEARRLLRELARHEAVLSETLSRREAPGSASVPRHAAAPAVAAPGAAMGGAVGPAETLPRRRAALRWALAAAALVLAAVGSWLFLRGDGHGLLYRGTELFSLEGEAPARETAFRPETRYLARSGEVRVGRARMEIKAPAIFTVLGRSPEAQEISLEAGHVFLDTGGRGQGFRLHTPKGVITDKGTTFTVQLNHAVEEAEMIRKVRSGSFPIFVLATVLMGQVSWQPAKGEERAVTPEMGPVKLADDFSAGKVADRDGLVLLKPVLGERWTPAEDEMPLAPGDWVKAAARGANAAELALADGSRLVVGPASLLEVVKAGTARLHQGEIEVRPAAGAKFELLGPGGARAEVDAPRVFRAQEGALIALEKEPAWLAGFKSKEATEALGSLLANVDGRDTPLTIGYHKVTVDIRDQIARTVVEESFANHTDVVLEGNFYFPLPQDASISGFAMWIGDELVEADIVEKERAREIYEEILREKRDPGLLEWTGGNIFKARVYPIPARGEKRIRITYTQVLPKTGSAYRYSYALESEMLKLNPLRELQVDVKIQSAEALASVSCPSHTARIQKAEHAAQVEFAAQEYVPSRDFEVIVETAPSDRNVAVIPHLRGEDGYFMVLLSVKAQAESRALVRDTDPLELLILADTSGSMTDSQLREERLFIASLLESLGEKDRFNLLGLDVAAAWAFETSVPATQENREKALAFLEKRGALGWTDLDLAFKEAVARARKGTQVVYVGDGIPTTGDADPVAFAERLKKLHGGEGTFHAVGVGSTQEMIVLRAIASLGGGSLHATGGGKDAVKVASVILAEITSPGMRGIQLEWKDIRVAAVYPEVLPNLPAGRQQIILGRYLPEGKELKGTLKVTGTMDGKKVAIEAPVAFSGAEEGNSFIPRFWARLHLDHLLAQGQSPQIREQIIALSEDYQIITPYTSFLVLESDADRERFQVTKRFRMRGGEEFFAEGREGATFELARQQMLRAKLWRQGLRKQVLALYESLGRNLEIPGGDFEGRRYGPGSAGDEAGFAPHGLQGLWRRPAGGDVDRQNAVSFYMLNPEDQVLGLERNLSHIEGFTEALNYVKDLGVRELAFEPAAAAAGVPEEEGADLDLSQEIESASRLGAAELAAPAATALALNETTERLLRRRAYSRGGEARYDLAAGLVPSRMGEPWRPPAPFSGIFPQPEAPAEAFQGKWPAEVRSILEKLNRRKAVEALKGGLRFAVESETIDFRGRSHPGERATHIVSQTSWASTSESQPGEAPFIRWLEGGRRGTLDAARLLGSRRKAEKGDEGAYPSPFDSCFDDLESLYRQYVPSVTKDGDVITLKLASRRTRGSEVLVTANIKEGTILEVAVVDKGKRIWTTTFGDFAAAGGLSWPRRIEGKDADGKTVRVTRVACEELSPEALKDAMARALAPLSEAILLDFPLPRLEEAKKHLADGKADFSDRWVLMSRFAGTQEWDRVKEHHAAAEALQAGKPGLVWIRLEVLKASRRNEEAKRLAFEVAKTLAAAASAGDFALARRLHGESSGIFQEIEKLELLAALKPAFERQDKRLTPMKTWSRWRLDSLQSLGRSVEISDLRRELAAAYPDDAGLQIEQAQALAERGELDQAVAHLEGAAEKGGPWTDSEITSFRNAASEILHSHRRLKDFLAYVDSWAARAPKTLPEYTLNRYLSALVFLGREDEADSLIAKWLQGARGGDPDPLEIARLGAAVWHALDRGADFERNRRIDARWRGPLADVARAFCTSEKSRDLAGRILRSDFLFHGTEEGKAVIQELHAKLEKETSTLPADVVRDFWYWLHNVSYVPGKGETSWDELARRVLERWEKEEYLDDRESLESILISHGQRSQAGAELVLELRRKQLARAEDEDEKAAAAGNLLGLLLSRPWSAEVEKEVLDLWKEVGSGKGRKATQASAIQRIARWMEDSRATKRISEIPEREKKSRRQLKPLEEEARAKALEDSLEALARLEAAVTDADLTPFARIERLSAEARAKREPARVLGELRSLILEIPERPERPEEDPLGPARDVLAQRALIVMGYISTRPGADPALADSELKLLDELIARKAKRPDAKLAKYRFLVALDRGDELEAALQAWVKEVVPDSDKDAGEPRRWIMPLGYVLAERGKVAEAVKTFESAGADLGPAEYAALAGWQMALGSKEKSREAKRKVYELTEEWQIANSLQASLQRYRRQGDAVPEELDEDVLLRFAVILRKSTDPQNHLGLLTAFYEATKDFRLLESLPDAILGQTAVKVYTFLGSLSGLLGKIDDEATSKRLHDHLKALDERLKAAGSKDSSEVDRRALSLLEFLVERRAADQAQGAGPHVEAALSALKAAFKGEWKDGERALMAGFLASVGKLVEKLRSEQLAQLRSLHDAAAKGSEERFEIAAHRAAALWANDRQEEAILVLGAALGEWKEARGGRLPQSANPRLSTYGSYLEGVGEYAAAEGLWRREIAIAENEAQRRWLEIQLFAACDHALRNGGTALLGKGAELYAALEREIEKALGRLTDEGHAAELVTRLCKVFKDGADKKVGGAQKDLSNFAYQGLPAVLNLYQYRNSQAMIRTLAYYVQQISGWRASLEFLLVRAENEPRWLERQGRDFWRDHSYPFAEARAKAGDLGSLEPRVLAVFTKEIRRDLEDRQSSNRYGYDKRQEHFWNEGAEGFFKAAMAVLDENKNSMEHVKYIAEYLFRGLERHEPAIEALLAFFHKGTLDAAGRWQLSEYLQEKERFAESIPVLLGLVEEVPGSADYRVRLMRAYHRTGQKEKLAATLKAADAYFHAEGRWSEGPAAALAGGCLDTEFFAESAAYYAEAITMHRKTAPNQGIGDGTLSSYYGNQARAWAGLGKTKEAVDAAAGAIVSWGKNIEQRAEAEKALLDVLKAAKDLDAYAAQLEAEVASTGLENPIVRKALGKVYAERKDFAKAARHLQAAVDSGPVDPETVRALVAALDAAGKPEEADSRLLALARSKARDFGLWKELGDRLTNRRLSAEAERAYDTLAEMSANESEGHAALAAVREAEKRFQEAAVQWRQVIRVRSKEPAGYLGLAKALLAAGDRAGAAPVLEEVLGKSWPARFGKVREEALKLRLELEKAAPR